MMLNQPNRVARVPSAVNPLLPLHQVLAKGPPIFIYNIPTAAPVDQLAELQDQIIRLQKRLDDNVGEVGRLNDEVGRLNGEVGRLNGEVGRLKGEVGQLKGEVHRLNHSTLPGLPVTLQCLLDAHLLDLGFDTKSPRSTFVTDHMDDIVEVLGINPSQVSHCFKYVICLLTSFFPDSKLPSRYHRNGSFSAHTTTSLSVADAISRLSMDDYDSLIWNQIFRHSFQMTVTDQLGDTSKIWLVDGRPDADVIGSRLQFIERGE